MHLIHLFFCCSRSKYSSSLSGTTSLEAVETEGRLCMNPKLTLDLYLFFHGLINLSLNAFNSPVFLLQP